MKQYEGHRSWNAWNVSLWLANDYDWYQAALETILKAHGNIGKAARSMRNNVLPEKTPDGAVFNQLSVKLALEQLIEN